MAPRRTPGINPNQGSFITAKSEEFGVENQEYLPPPTPIGEYVQDAPAKIEFALQALSTYAEQSQARGFAKKLMYDHLKAEAVNGYDEVEETRTYHAIDTVMSKAETLGNKAMIQFAQAIGIEVEEVSYETDRGWAVTIRTTYQNQQREFDARYQPFFKHYAGAPNAKNRNDVKAGNKPILIPGYSGVDRHFDHLLSQMATKQIDPYAPLEEIPEMSLAEQKLEAFRAQGIRIDMVHFIRYQLLALKALGSRNSKIAHHGSVYQKHGIVLPERTPPDKIELPKKRDDETEWDYIQKRLHIDQLNVFAVRAVRKSIRQFEPEKPGAASEEVLAKAKYEESRIFMSQFGIFADPAAAVERERYREELVREERRYRKDRKHRLGQMATEAAREE